MRRVLAPIAVACAVMLSVFAPGANAAPAPVDGVGAPELTYACALRSNGLLRAVVEVTGCKPAERLVTFKPGPTYVCVQPSGSARWVGSLTQCRPPALRLTLPPTSGQAWFCVTIGTRAIRYVTEPAQCSSGETLYQIGGNDGAPTLVSTTPVTGAAQVGTTSSVSFTWSEPVTATTAALTAVCGGSPAPGTLGGSGTATLTFTPDSALPQGASCTVTADAALISDVDGLDPPDHPTTNASTTFTTDSAPTVVSVTPATGTTGVPGNANLTVVLSEPVTLDAGALDLLCGTITHPPFTVTGGGTATLTVNPDTDLAAGLTCTLTVDLTKVHDVDAGDPPDTGTGTVSSTFTTADAAPTLVSVSPAAGATQVATDVNVVLTFSEPVQVPTAGAFLLACSGVPQGFTMPGLSGTTLTIDPAGLLPAGQTCTVTADAAQVTDVDTVDPPDALAANISTSFGTDAAPAVTSTTPAAGATGVGTGSTLSVTFSEPVTAAAGAFTLSCQSVDRPLGVTGSGTATLTLTPLSPLPGSASCSLTVHASAISDVDAADPPDHPAADTTVGFTTLDSAPTVTSTNPAAGATGVARGTTVGITFSEPVTFDAGAFAIECPTGSPVAFGLTTGASSATLTPTSPLPTNATCTVTVTASKVHDVDAVDPPDVMAADYTFAFTTTPNSAPTDLTLSPSSVAENASTGTTVGTLTTTDPDVGDTFTYALVGGTGSTDNASFSISGAQVLTAASFDFETKSSYGIRVRSTDGGGSTIERAVTVTVTNVNEAPTDIALSGSTIAENQPIATTVGTLSGTDPDTGQTLAFSLQASGCGGSFADNAAFSIAGTALRSAAVLDFETKSSYTICVRATDNGSPVRTYDEQFTITVTDVNEAPVAAPQSYSGVVGNTLAVRGTTSAAPNVAIGGNLLGVGATDPDAGDVVSVVAETVASTKGGTATVNADGSFTYLPPTGLKSTTDTFTFRVTDGDVQAAGTATMTIGATLVWYVDNTAAAGGTGRSPAPFNALTPVNGAGGAGDADATGEIIFVFAGSGSYGGGLVLEADQVLLGQRAGLAVGGTTIVPAGATSPVLTNATGDGLTLASGVQVGGLDITSPSGDGLHGTAVTTASVGVSSPVAVTGAGGDGVDLGGSASGVIQVNAAISGSVGRSVAVSGRTGGTTAFGGAVSGKGIELAGNAGATVSFTGLLTIATTTTPAFSATGGGTVVSTNAASTLASTTGRALDVVDTTIGAAGFGFLRISANGAANGIRLSNTGSVGRLAVLGSGTTTVGGDDSGGTIRSTTGAGILLDRTSNPSFRNMSVTDTGGPGVSGVAVTDFTFTSGKINNSGLVGAAPANSNISLTAGGVTAANVTGSVTVTNNLLTNAYAHGVHIANGVGTISSLHVDGNTITSAATTTSSTGNGVMLQVSGTAGTAASLISGTISNNTVTGFPLGGGIVAIAGNEQFASAPSVTLGSASGPSALAIAGNKVSGFSAANPMNTQCISVTVTGRATGFVDVTNNGTGAAPLGLNKGICVNLSVDGAANVTSQVTGNVVKPQTQLSGTYGISGGTDRHVYAAGTLDSAVLRANVSNNIVSSTTGVGIYFIANSTGSSYLKVQGNNAAAPTDAVARSGIRVDSGTSVGTAVNTTVCLTISGNTSAGASDGANLAPGISLRKQGTVAATNTYGITGLPNNPATAAQVQTYVTGLNPASTTGNFGSGGVAVLSGANFIPCTMPAF